MKLHLLLIAALATLLPAALATKEDAPLPASGKKNFPAVKDLGNVMYIGDSITQGVGTPSYRWQLFKIWVDNGIGQTEVGVHRHNYKGGLKPGTVYGTRRFLNVHSAVAAQRAHDISGRDNSSDRMDSTNIYDWLGLDKTYSGTRRINPATENPASYFLMIGTSDTLYDSGKAGIGSCIEEKLENLLGKGGDMDTIVKAMRQANPKARIAVTTIPTWAPNRANNGRPADYAAVKRYNDKLKDWGKSRNLAVIDVNRGLADIGSKLPHAASEDFFLDDKIHPTPQAELLMAGNIARQLGYAGRTAGLKRWPSQEFPQHAPQLAEGAPGVKVGKKGGIEFKGAFSCLAPDSSSRTATAELCLTKMGYGNGAKAGWDTDHPLVLSLTTAAGMGTIAISECSIRWGEGWGRVLYNGDMSKLADPIRIAYVEGNPAQGLAEGFYVWLGDMLIGEALNPAEYKRIGLELSCPTTVRLARLDYDPQKAWAPPTTRFTNSNPLFGSDAGVPDNTPSDTEATPGAKVTKTTPGPLSGFFLCSGTMQGNVDTTFDERGSNAGLSRTRWNSLCLGELDGSVSLTFAPGYAETAAWLPFFAAANGKGVSGDATFKVESESFHQLTAPFGSVGSALAGVFRSNVAGTIKFLLHRGTYEGTIYGGATDVTDTSTIGSTYIELGAASFGRDVYAGGVSGTINGDTALVIDGAARVLGNTLSAGGHLAVAGCKGGNILGNSSVTLRSISPDSPMASYKGTISGGVNIAGKRKLVLDAVTLGGMGAILADFDEIHITNGSAVSLGSLGGATKVVVDATSRLTLTEGTYEASILNDGSIELARGCTLKLQGEDSGQGRYTVRKGATLKGDKAGLGKRLRQEGSK